MNPRRDRKLALVLISAALLLCSVPALAWAENKAAKVNRVGGDIKYLASDELEGRGPDTPGLQKAAEFIRDRFKELGLKSGTKDGSYFRPFEISIDNEVVKSETSLVLRGPDGQELRLKMGEDYQPLATGGSGQVKGQVVFAGYGISAEDLEYDDYQGNDVAGKVVLILRREPQQENPHSKFNGEKLTKHSYIRTKLNAAKQAKAAAVLLVNDIPTTKEAKKDELSKPNGFGSSSMGIPFAHLKQSIANQLLKNVPLKADETSLANLEAVSQYIDEKFTPVTQPLEGWTAELETKFKTVKSEVTNVVGVLEGEGPHADETIVIGAHYDHLGYGPFGSRRPNERAIHNGADDNATGTAAVMELARRFAQRSEKPARRLVFIAFTAEERGIIGSNYYLEKPLFPLEKTVAMINFDMIGNLGDDGLLVGGVKTGKPFADLIEKVSKNSELKIKPSNSLGGSDHAGFYRKEIPVLFFFTGLTDLYHTPDDDFETINVDGTVQVIDFAEQVLSELTKLPKAPEYVKVSRSSSPGRGSMAYLGVVPDYGAGDGNGLRITDVSADSPAAKGGLQGGDVIIQFGEIEVADIQGLAAGLQKYKAGQKVKIVVQRDKEKKTLEVELGSPRGGR